MIPPPRTICSWLSKTCTCKRLPHAWVKSSILSYTPRALSGLSSTETHSRTSSSSIPVNSTKDSMVSRHAAANGMKGTRGGYKTMVFKCLKKRGFDQIICHDLFCTPYSIVCSRLSSTVVFDCRMDL